MIKMLNKKSCTFLLTILFVIILIKTAWISDDISFTIRSVLNFIHGYGATFNIDERVQAYTHPLWFLILSILTLLFKNIYFVNFLACILISTAVFYLSLKYISKNIFGVFFITFAIFLSRAFIEFSTSGLENPLSHLLILILFMRLHKIETCKKKDLTHVILIGSFLYLSRPDLILFILPISLKIFFLLLENNVTKKDIVKSFLVGGIPIIVWTSISLIYYGFPFPNTAYAKLLHEIPRFNLIYQGGKYFFITLKKDPVTLFIIFSGIIFAWTQKFYYKYLAIGNILYLVYIVYIGADFMEGRFFSVPFLVSLLLITPQISQKNIVPLMVPTLILASVSTVIPVIYMDKKDIGSHGYDNFNIGNDRMRYIPYKSLLKFDFNRHFIPEWETTSKKEVLFTCGNANLAINKGPTFHYIDQCALSDPLLARLPNFKVNKWMAGHFWRQMPTNYMASVTQNKNLLLDSDTREYWDSIRKITHGSIWSFDRFIEIFKFNFGLHREYDFEQYKSFDPLKGVDLKTRSNIQDIQK